MFADQYSEQLAAVYALLYAVPLMAAVVVAAVALWVIARRPRQ